MEAASDALGPSVLKHLRRSYTRKITIQAWLMPTLAGEVHFQLYEYTWCTTVL